MTARVCRRRRQFIRPTTARLFAPEDAPEESEQLLQRVVGHIIRPHLRLHLAERQSVGPADVFRNFWR
jgi:hypothetical protein